MNQQLSLPIHQIDDETLENFYSDNNALLLNSLRQNMTDLQQQFFYLWGNQKRRKNSSSTRTPVMNIFSNNEVRFMFH